MAYYGWMQEGPVPNNSGIFAACNTEIKKGVSNGVSGLPELILSENTITDTTRCCLQYCMNPVELCKQKCPNGSGCEKICTTQENMCLETCLLSSDKWSTDLNPYFVCAHKHGCLDTGEDKDNCLKHNYDKIMSCCKLDKCRPSPSVDCEDLCDMSHKLALETNLEFEIDPSVALRQLFIKTLRDNSYAITENYSMPKGSRRTHPYTRIS